MILDSRRDQARRCRPFAVFENSLKIKLSVEVHYQGYTAPC